MVYIIPFAAWRPSPQEAATFACPPYDVVSREQAATLEPQHRFLSVIRPEISLPAEVDEDSPQAHEQASRQLTQFEESGVLIHDSQPQLYIYRQEGFAHVQTGIVACVRVADYRNGTIKQHEKTLVAKELNRIHHFEATQAQTEPVFLMHRPDAHIAQLVQSATAAAVPIYDFTSEDGVHHMLWTLSSAQTEDLVRAFAPLSALYIADGHHRSASAVKVAEERGLDDGDPRASIMAVIFPGEDLKVLAYNRVVRDLHGMSPCQFLEKMSAAGYALHKIDQGEQAEPERRAEFGIYIAPTHAWYRASYHGEKTGNVVADLDTSILTRTVLDPLLGIKDLRTDSRISFVGGSAGIHELEKQAADQGIAFSLFPTAVADIMAVSDAGEIMPPKSTWFEPKLASGLFIHDLA